jgi:hypothetical protein
LMEVWKGGNFFRKSNWCCARSVIVFVRCQTVSESSEWKMDGPFANSGAEIRLRYALLNPRG